MAVSLVLLTLVAGIATVPLHGSEPDLAQRIGAGNVTAREPAARLDLLHELGAGHCRIPIGQNEYWKNGIPTTEATAKMVLPALRRGIRPVLLFEYYTRWHGELGGHDQWHAIGRSFARQFRPGSDFLKQNGINDRGVVLFTAINEPMWKSNNPQPIPVDAYVEALKGLAGGVHSIDAQLKVSPGGFQDVPLFFMPWNIFHTADKDEHYGMCHSAEPWKSTARGRLIQSLCQLTRGMRIDSTAPETTGITRLTDGKRLLIVWQNRRGWTERPGDSLQLDAIPPSARKLRIHSWRGLLRESPLEGDPGITLSELPGEQTLMFAIE